MEEPNKKLEDFLEGNQMNDRERVVAHYHGREKAEEISRESFIQYLEDEMSVSRSTFNKEYRKKELKALIASGKQFNELMVRYKELGQVVGNYAYFDCDDGDLMTYISENKLKKLTGKLQENGG